MFECFTSLLSFASVVRTEEWKLAGCPEECTIGGVSRGIRSGGHPGRPEGLLPGSEAASRCFVDAWDVGSELFDSDVSAPPGLPENPDDNLLGESDRTVVGRPALHGDPRCLQTCSPVPEDAVYRGEQPSMISPQVSEPKGACLGPAAKLVDECLSGPALLHEQPTAPTTSALRSVI